MKICTITCHDVYNHGASLQAYALMTYLNNLGHEVEIIDYKPDYLSNHYNIFSIDNPRWKRNLLTKIIYLSLKVPTRIAPLKRKKSFDEFRKNYLNITNKRYTSNDELKNDVPDSDAFICGSDQIWNSLHKNGRDKAFYLDFVPDNKIKASYAASFATDSIDNKFKPMVRELTSRLDGVGVRETSGVNILKELGVENVTNVLDPVFLLNDKAWDKLAKENFNEKYILVYDFDRNPLIKKIAKDIAKEKGCKIYSINTYKVGYEDKVFKYSGPNTFVSLIKNAEFVISNSFHSVVFSVIYEKQMAIVNRTENINTRMRDLLSILGLQDRLICNENYSINSILNDINYKSVKENLNNRIAYSKEYIEKILTLKKLYKK